VPQVAAQYIHKTMVNASMTVTNMIGPVEKMSLANHPIKGMYFAIAGNPQVRYNHLSNLINHLSSFNKTVHNMC
jgi:hypothetical protein